LHIRANSFISAYFKLIHSPPRNKERTKILTVTIQALVKFVKLFTVKYEAVSMFDYISWGISGRTMVPA